jgi:hypothetical protein
MEEDLITLNTANLAKEKGFPYYGGKSYYEGVVEFNNLLAKLPSGKLNSEVCFPSPTQSLLQKWLREIHNIDVDVVRDSEVHYQDETRWIVKVSNWNDIQVKEFSIAHLKFPNHSHHTDFKSYEEALEKGLIEGLNFIDDESI